MSSSPEPSGQANALAELEELLGMVSLLPSNTPSPDSAIPQPTTPSQRTLGNAAARQWAETQRAKRKPPQTQSSENDSVS